VLESAAGGSDRKRVRLDGAVVPGVVVMKRWAGWKRKVGIGER